MSDSSRMVRPTPVGQSGPPPGAFDAAKVLRDLRHGALLVVGILVAGLLLGYLAERQLPRRYTSSATILIDPKRPGAYGAEGTFENLYIDNNKLASVALILVSPGVLERVVRAKNLVADREFGDPGFSLKEALGRLIPALKPTPVADTPDLRERRALARLARAIRSARIGFTYGMTVSVVASKPERAQSLAQAVVESYILNQIEEKYAAAQRDVEWLSHRLDHLRAELISSEEAVGQIRSKSRPNPDQRRDYSRRRT